MPCWQNRRSEYLLITSTPFVHLKACLDTLRETLDTVRTSLTLEKSARKFAQARLKKVEAAHARAMKAIETECRAPFVVPALLQAFLEVSALTDQVLE